jgi:PAS domain S-box-containing protein
MVKAFKIKKFLSLIAIFIVTTVFVTCLSVFVIHRQVTGALQQILYHIADDERVLLDSLSARNKNESEILAHLNSLFARHFFLGKTGEFVIAKQVGDSIVFLYYRNATDSYKQLHIYPNSNRATPMQLALSGKSGTVEGYDYTGQRVYAGYSYCKDLKWGIEAKISTAEIEKPYIEASIIAFTVIVIVILLVGVLYVRITNPIVDSIVKNEDQLSLILNSAAEAIFGLDMDGNCTFCNNTGVKLLGYRHSIELMGKNMHLLIHYKYPDETLYPIDSCPIFRSIQKGEEAHVDTEVFWRADGSSFFAEYWAYPQYHNGTIVGAVVTFMDITERKRVGKALKDSEGRFRSLFENHNAVMLLIEPESGAIVDANYAATKFYGYSQEKIRMLNIADINMLAPSEIKLERLQAMETPKKHFVFPHRLANGETRTVEVHSSPIVNNEQPLLFSIVHDITDRKKAEEALNKLSKATEQSPASIVITDLDGNIEYVNPKFSKLTGYTLEEAIGQNPRILKSGNTSGDEYRELWESISSGKEWHGEFRNRKKNGEVYYESAVISCIIDDKGKVTHYLAVKEDITERKLTEQKVVEFQKSLQTQNQELMAAKLKAEESDRLKTAFLTNMSHEVRTPMNAIIGFSELLANGGLTEDKRLRFSSLVKERTHDLLRIIEDILEVSKIDVGLIKFIESDIILSKFMDELYLSYNRKIGNSDSKSKVVLKLTLADDLKKTVIRVDGQRLRQIFSNLLDNAMKFTHQGHIEFGCRSESEMLLVFFVKDTGIGIPADKQKIVFDRFRQADEALSARQYGGAGLGLSIVKGIVNLMHGEIWFESDVSLGSEFKFSLPVRRMEQSRVGEHVVNSASSLPWTDKTVLIVEDDEANAEYLKEILSGQGLTLLHAFNGADALNMFRKYPAINLVLMDLGLPDMDGLTITRIIKKEKPFLAVIAQTAYASASDAVDCIDAGCNDYLSKPINAPKLLSMVGQFLNANS